MALEINKDTEESDEALLRLGSLRDCSVGVVQKIQNIILPRPHPFEGS